MGRGGSTDSIYAAFVASPTHYENVVDPAYTEIGIGVVQGADGKQYTVQRYLAPSGIPRWDLRRRLRGRLRRPRTHHDHDATSAAATTPSATRAPRPRGPDRAAVVLDALQQYER